MLVQSLINIQNLHCSSCVRTIKQSLSVLSPRPSSVDASTSVQTVMVVHEPDLTLHAIQTTLLGAGFNISVNSSQALGETLTAGWHTLSGNHEKHLESCLECSGAPVVCTPRSPKAPMTEPYPTREQSIISGTCKLTLSVGGMTCSSCTRGIKEVMNQIPGVTDVVVSLIDNSATATLSADNLAGTIRDSIEECGYEAQIVSLESDDKTIDAEQTAERTIALKVDGAFCPKCPKKIMSALESLKDDIIIEKPLTTHTDPVIVITYIPRLPSFSIRDVASTVASSSDPPFRVTVHHPPTLEQLSRAVRLRERRHILFRLIFSLVAAIPTFIIGIVYMTLVKDGNPGKKYLMEPIWAGNASRLHWALFFIATPVMFYSANVYHYRSIKEIRALWRRGSQVPLLARFTRFGSMNLLVTSGVSVAYFASLALLILAATSAPTGEADNTTYFDAVVFLTMFLLIGRFMEAVSKARTADAITALSSLRPAEALLIVPDSFTPAAPAVEDLEKGRHISDELVTTILPGTKVERVSVDFLEVGDIICVPNGSTPPADGTIVGGEKSVFDESSLTGESRLVSKSSGDKVYVGTINKGRMVHVKVDAIGGSTMLDNIVKVVREGQTRRAPIERVADVITSYFVPVVTLLAIATWIIWLVLGLSGALPNDYLDIKVGGWAVWSLRFAIAVFVVACPCGIGLAAPTALLVGMGLAAKNGILARGGGEAFQEMSQLGVIVFDKTGTLTEGGEPQVSDFVCTPRGRITEDIIKGVAAELEATSSHPLATAIRQYCQGKTVGVFAASNSEEIAGRGLKATFGSLHCSTLIGNEAWMHDHGAWVDEILSERLEGWKSEGKSVVLEAILDEEHEGDGRKYEIVAAFAISDALRPEASEVVSWFQKRGIDTWMISGDNPKTACAVATSVGIPITNVIAGVLPHEKSEKVQQLQRGGTDKRDSKTGRTVVAMVGDGINDAPVSEQSQRNGSHLHFIPLGSFCCRYWHCNRLRKRRGNF
ncbi:hypothetical protein AX17_000924 [Amanita inopinata Kibby_2008]|nr:hypothetical protein AX17_000924 [Amanita inopinata Kibby_2008]